MKVSLALCFNAIFRNEHSLTRDEILVNTGNDFHISANPCIILYNYHVIYRNKDQIED
jgi:hypothetical protein